MGWRLDGNREDTDKVFFIDDDTSFDSCDSFVHIDHDHDISFLTIDEDDDDDGDEEDDDDDDDDDDEEEEEPKEGKENNSKKKEKKKKLPLSIHMMKKGGIMNRLKLTSSSSKQQPCPPAPINVTVKENDNGNDGGINVNIETLLKGYNDNDDFNSNKMNSTIRRKKNDHKLSWKKRLISISIFTSLSSK